ncbi:MAG: 4Fe-4S ferredoxin, partial [Oscillospiraceae bacterium]
DHHDHFVNTTPNTEWESCLAHCVKLGMGSREYKLITVK